MITIPQLNPADFAAWRDSVVAAGLRPVVLDVREPWELQTASVSPAGFELVTIPMREVPVRLAELQPEGDEQLVIACLCHHGMRSLQVANFLRQNEFEGVVNLQGGIDAWSRQLDAGVPLY